MAEIPHFSIPFRFDPLRGAAVTEQDSEQEILDCIEVILRYTIGDRPEKPEFGIPDQTFSMPSPNTNLIRAALSEWEERINMEVGEPVLNKVNPLIQGILVKAGNPNA